VLGAVADETSPVDVSVQATSKQRGRVVYAVTAALKPNAPAGPIQAHIQLYTNDQANPNVLINVVGAIQAPFSVYPAGPVRFDSARVGEGTSKRINIAGPKPFNIEKVEGEGDGVSVELLQGGPNKVQVVKIAFQPTQAGQFSREVRLYTDATNFVRVPVEGTAVAP
jgi:hypothetical protein